MRAAPTSRWTSSHPQERASSAEPPSRFLFPVVVWVQRRRMAEGSRGFFPLSSWIGSSPAGDQTGLFFGAPGSRLAFTPSGRLPPEVGDPGCPHRHCGWRGRHHFRRLHPVRHESPSRHCRPDAASATRRRLSHGNSGWARLVAARHNDVGRTTERGDRLRSCAGGGGPRHGRGHPGVPRTRRQDSCAHTAG